MICGVHERDSFVAVGSNRAGWCGEKVRSRQTIFQFPILWFQPPPSPPTRCFDPQKVPYRRFPLLPLPSVQMYLSRYSRKDIWIQYASF